jgi:hypothetical protein
MEGLEGRLAVRGMVLSLWLGALAGMQVDVTDTDTNAFDRHS